MGFNTVVLVLNDAVHLIEQDPQFGKNLAQAIHMQPSRDSGYRGKETAEVSSGSFCSAAEVLSSRHADDIQIVAVGGNMGLYLGTVYGSRHLVAQDGKEQILRQLADSLGFRLVKKPVKKERR